MKLLLQLYMGFWYTSLKRYYRGASRQEFLFGFVVGECSTLLTTLVLNFSHVKCLKFRVPSPEDLNACPPSSEDLSRKP